jgi:RimJ/RimL family protein N-acetyltransferase
MPITLVPLAVEHLQALHGVVSAEEFAEYAAQPDVYYCRSILDEGTCVGTVGLNLADAPHIVVATVPDQRRKGYATAAVQKMARFAFEELGLSEIFAMCRVGRPSNRVAVKLGFAFVEQQGNDCLYKLTNVDWRAGQSARALPDA